MKTKYTLLLLSALLLAFMSSCSDVKTGNNMKEETKRELALLEHKNDRNNAGQSGLIRIKCLQKN